MRQRNVVCLLVCLLLTKALCMDESVEQRVRSALEDLNNDEFRKREDATARIADFPAEAVPLLKQALADSNAAPEVKSRLAHALEGLCAKHAKALFRKRVELRHAWLKKVLQDAYEQVGSKNEKWDALAREALRLAVIDWANDFGRDYDEEARIFDLTTKAMAAGCDDALIEYVHVFSDEQFNKPRLVDDLNASVKAAKHMAASPYSPFLRFYVSTQAWNILLKLRPPPEQAGKRKTELSAAYKDLLGKLEEFLKDPEITDDWIEQILWTGIDLGMEEEPDRKKILDALCAVLEKGRPKNALLHRFRGDTYTDYAWDARGSGWANTVTDDGWKLMKERLAIAEKELNTAWTMDPGSSSTARAMINVVMGSGGDREKMELWFKRAMAANPFDTLACKGKMTFLEPKWHGSAEDLIAFGRECLKTGDWYSDVPYTLVEIHACLSFYTKKGRVFNPEYFKKPEVWKDMQDVFESCLKARPKDAQMRTRYAKQALFAEKWDIADKQFKMVGDAAYKSSFASAQEFTRMRDYAAKMAAGDGGKK